MELKLPVRRETESLWFDANQSELLGCAACHNESICGGLRIKAPAFSCRSFCRCSSDVDCEFVCPSRGASYVRYIREVRGLALDNIPRSEPLDYPEIPETVPMIYGRESRSESLNVPWAAIPLAALFSRRNGNPKYATRAELAAAFLINPDSRIVISGVDVDKSLERYWQLARAQKIVEVLAALKPDLVTAPNFSLFVDAPREDNLHNLKRIAICWSEMVSEGLPAALHVNARTDRDWDRWTAFITERPEVTALSFEFATGSKFGERGRWHADQLCSLASRVGRDLHLVIRGRRHLPQIKGAFARVTVIDTDVYMKTMGRRHLHCDNGVERWSEPWALENQPLDDILERNAKAAVTR